MKENLLYTVFFVVCLMLSTISIVGAYQLKHIMQDDFLSQKDTEEIEEIYDSLIVKIERDDIDSEQLAELFETIRESDVSRYRYEAALNESMSAFAYQIMSALVFQSVIIFAIWRRSQLKRTAEES